VLVARGDTGEWPAPVRAHALYANPGGYATAAPERLRLLAGVWGLRGEADLLHFFFQPHPLAVRSARWLARLCGRPTVHTALSAPAEGPPPRSLRFAHRTITLSRATARRLAVPGSRPPDVIPPALLETEPAPSARVRAALADAQLEPGFLLYPGDWEFSGGHDLLLEVWSRDRTLPQLVFAGRDKTPRATAARAALEHAAREMGHGDRVRFLGTVADLPALLASSGAVLFPARSLYAKTDLPLVVLEAWRESRAVLVGDLPPLAEAVEGVADPIAHDPAPWLDAVRRLARDGEALGRAGRERFLERHTARGSAERYAAIYREVMQERRT
jgi:glycosyltransferase involved in cell wall biosynthesis